MNSILEFLAENYLYVAMGSLFVIILLIVIIIVSNKKANKKEKEEMVNIGDIKTGSIDEVAGSMSMENDSELQPQSIGELTQSIPVIEKAPEATKPVETAPVVEPTPAISALGINLDDIKIHALQDLRPLVEKLNVSNEEKFDILTCVDGEGIIEGNGYSEKIKMGDSYLIPATLGEYKIQGKLTVLKSYPVVK